MIIKTSSISAVSLSVALLLSACGVENPKDNIGSASSFQEVNHTYVSSQEDTAADNITSETASEEEISSEEAETDSKEEPTAESSEETSESSEPATSSKPAANPQPAAHDHSYYKPKDAYKYIGEVRFGWVDEEDYGIIYPTCTEQGFTVYVCSICEHVKFEDYTEATGHTFEQIYNKYPTHDSDGYEEIECSKCGYREKTGVTYPKRLGDLSGIDEGIELRDSDKVDWFYYAPDYGSIIIYDFRLYECHVPTMTIEHENQRIAITYDLEDR